MKWFMRGLSAPLLCVGMLGVLGCGPDNESEVDRLNKTQPLGDPGKPNPDAVSKEPETPSGPMTQEQFFKAQQQRQNEMFNKGPRSGKK